MALLPDSERQKKLDSLSDEETLAILYDWKGTWARKNQLPPTEDWFIWLLLSGRGFGKTRIGAEMVRKWAKAGFTPIALIGQTKADVRDTMIEVGESAILNISPPDFMPVYEPTKRRLTWPNGVQAISYSGDEPDQLRGPQHMKIWADEVAKFMYPQRTWDNLMLGLRIGGNPQVIVTTTPRPLTLLRELVSNKRCVVTRGHTLDNKLNLAPEFLKYVMSMYEGTKLGRQELAGELLEQMEGLVYDAFKPSTCIIPRFALPDKWPRYFGQDFGAVNTAAVWYALDPDTGFLYLYRTYKAKASVLEHAQKFKELSEGEQILRKVGGNHQEQEARDGYSLAGWFIAEPKHSNDRMERIRRVNSLHCQNKIYIFSDLHDYIDEKLSFSYEIDREDRLQDKIYNEAMYHFMSAEGYLLSEFHPDVVGVGAKPRVK
ncbi:hypothetical protein LCGC14_1960700, partial [marine sediment metagenome]